MSTAIEAIVAGSHLRYDGVWQRPQQLLSRFAARVPVLFLEEPFLAEEDRDEVIEQGGLTVLRPLRRRPSYGAVDTRTLGSIRAWLGDRMATLWVYTPMMLALTEVSHRILVYDCMDDLASFRFAPADLRERESALLARADLVFAGGASLYEARRSHGAKVRLYPSGVDFEHFAAAQVCAPHPLCRVLERPILGYFGVVDERIDLAILAALAAAGLHTVVVGPLAKIDPRDLPRSPYLHFTGALAYGLLPELLAGFDAALMPFAMNEATRFISPTKTPEYLAGGKPVVSTPIADVVRAYDDVVWFAQTPEAFVHAARAAALHPDAPRRERGIALARDAGWDGLVERMSGDIDECLQARDAAAQ